MCLKECLSKITCWEFSSEVEGIKLKTLIKKLRIHFKIFLISHSIIRNLNSEWFWLKISIKMFKIQFSILIYTSWTKFISFSSSTRISIRFSSPQIWQHRIIFLSSYSLTNSAKLINKTWNSFKILRKNVSSCFKVTNIIFSLILTGLGPLKFLISNFYADETGNWDTFSNKQSCCFQVQL